MLKLASLCSFHYLSVFTYVSFGVSGSCIPGRRRETVLQRIQFSPFPSPWNVSWFFFFELAASINNYLRNISSFSLSCLFLLPPTFARIRCIRNEVILLSLAPSKMHCFGSCIWRFSFATFWGCSSSVVLILLVWGLGRQWWITRCLKVSRKKELLEIMKDLRGGKWRTGCASEKPDYLFLVSFLSNVECVRGLWRRQG